MQFLTIFQGNFTFVPALVFFHQGLLFLFTFQASKRKVYMLFNLQPDRSVTGGAWYSDQDFESEFVEVLNQQCYKFLQDKVRVNYQT